MTSHSLAFKNFPIGIALAVVGYVAIRKGIEGLSRPLVEGDVVHIDDRVETDAESDVVIGFADGSSIDLPAGAEVVLDAEVFDPGEVREMHSHNAALEAMQQSILSGSDVPTALQAAQQSYASISGVGADILGDLAPSSAESDELGSKQPIGGDLEIHTLPEMLLPRISIIDMKILEPAPGNEDEDHDSDHDDTTHDSDQGDTTHGSGHDDTTQDSGHDDTTHDDSSHDSGHDDSTHDDSTHDDSTHDSDHDSGADSGHSAGQGGGYGYAGGSLSSIAVFTVSLSSPATRDVRVDFQTVNGTAIAGGQGVDTADYGHTSGSLMIPAGQSSGTIEVEILSDKVVEGDEYFFLTLSNPVNAMIVDDTSIGTIIDSGHGHGVEGEGETLIGTVGDDVLTTKGGADTLEGLAGNDTLIAGGGPDTIHGGEGDDLIVGLGGADQLYGEAGDDEIVGHGGPDEIHGGTGDDIIYAGGAPDTVNGGPGNDFINAEGGPDLVDGGEGDDIIYGGGGPDALLGGGGDDVIRGEGGPDILDGGPGDDELYGGGGPDQLIGGEGADIMKGGGSGDVFRFEDLDGEIDRIVDFSQHDQIDISAILDIEEGDPITDYVQLNQSSSEESSFELSVNPSGSGSADDFELVVILENLQSDPDLDQLISNGNLLVIE